MVTENVIQKEIYAGGETAIDVLDQAAQLIDITNSWSIKEQRLDPNEEVLPNGKVFGDYKWVSGKVRYVVEEKPFEEGGHSSIFKAYDSVLGKTVAVKMINETKNWLEPASARLHREAVEMAKVDLPGIVKVIDFAEQEVDRLRDDNRDFEKEKIGNGLLNSIYNKVTPGEKRSFLVCEFVDSPTLSTALRNSSRGLGLYKTLDIASQLSLTLDKIYEDQGIIHRDITPGNVYLSEPFIKISDFGITNTVDRPDKNNNLRVSALSAPPEGENPSEVSRQSDVFSLAVLSYRCLTGSMPYKDLPRLWKIQDNEPPLTIRENKVLTDVLGLSKEQIERLELVYKKALAINPTDRYKTCSDFSMALRTALLDH